MQLERGSELRGPAPYETPHLTPHLTPPPELITSRHPIAFGEGRTLTPSRATSSDPTRETNRKARNGHGAGEAARRGFQHRLTRKATPRRGGAALAC